jgi:predicted nucleotidyltransferase
MVDRAIIDSIQRYLRALLNRGLEPSFGVLFGSQVKGNTHQWSDIDLVVVARRFDETDEYEPRALLWRVAGRLDARIEPVACGLKQWEEDDGTPIFEVARRDGVIVYA